MNERESGSSENGPTETKSKAEPVPPIVKPVRSLPDPEPEYRVQVLLPDLLQTYPKHVVLAVLEEHSLAINSLITKSSLVAKIEAWLKGAVNG